METVPQHFVWIFFHRSYSDSKTRHFACYPAVTACSVVCIQYHYFYVKICSHQYLMYRNLSNVTKCNLSSPHVQQSIFSPEQMDYGVRISWTAATICGYPLLGCQNSTCPLISWNLSIKIAPYGPAVLGHGQEFLGVRNCISPRRSRGDTLVSCIGRRRRRRFSR